MGVSFFEGREIPAQLQHSMGGYGAHEERFGDGATDFLNAGANLVEKASPWDFLTGLFVTKPAMEAQAAVQAQQFAAQTAQADALSKAKTMRTVMYVGAGLLGVVVLAAMMKQPRQVAGYRRKKRRHR